MAETLYGKAAIEAESIYPSLFTLRDEHARLKESEIQGRDLSWDEFEDVFEKEYGEVWDCAWDDEKRQDFLIQRYGDEVIVFEVVSDTPDEDERVVLQWLTDEILAKQKWCGVCEWDDSPLGDDHRTAMALERLVAKGTLKKDKDHNGMPLYLVPYDLTINLDNVMCDACADEIRYLSGTEQFHKTCAHSLIAALQKAIDGDSPH